MSACTEPFASNDIKNESKTFCIDLHWVKKNGQSEEGERFCQDNKENERQYKTLGYHRLRLDVSSEQSRKECTNILN